MAIIKMSTILGINVCRLLHKKRKKQVDLANKLGISESYISRICNGQHFPNKHLYAIAKFFGVAPWELLKEEKRRK